MTTEELVTELNSCLGTVARERAEFREGLDQLLEQFKNVRKLQLKKLQKETCKSKRRLLKKDLRKVERVYQGLR